jgi:hypothetical protein
VQSKGDKTAENALWLKKMACKQQLQSDCDQELTPWWKCMKCVHQGLTLPEKGACTTFNIQDQDAFCHSKEESAAASANSSHTGHKKKRSPVDEMPPMDLKDISIKTWVFAIAAFLGIVSMLMLSFSNNGPTLEEMEAAARLEAIHGKTGAPKKRDGPGGRKGKAKNSPAVRDAQDWSSSKYQVSRNSLTEPRRRSLTSALALEV